MLYPDLDASRQLARERQAELKRDWARANHARTELVESRQFRRRKRLRISLPPAAYES